MLYLLLLVAIILNETYSLSPTRGVWMKAGPKVCVFNLKANDARFFMPTLCLDKMDVYIAYYTYKGAENGNIDTIRA
jgi:hypothetical protein